MEIDKRLAEEIRKDISAYGVLDELGRSQLNEKTYPEIDLFKVEIFPNERQHAGRPHCKVTTDKGAVSVDLNTCEIITGNAKQWNRTIEKVVHEHQAGLLAEWDRLRPDDQRLN